MARRTASQSFGLFTVARSRHLPSASGSGAPTQCGSRAVTFAGGAANVTTASYDSCARVHGPAQELRGAARRQFAWCEAGARAADGTGSP
ncbi:hypothetical protein STENM223S_07745 [Streptomyces tendae]